MQQQGLISPDGSHGEKFEGILGDVVVGAGADKGLLHGEELLPDVLLLTAGLVVPAEALGVQVTPGLGVLADADMVSFMDHCLLPITAGLISPYMSIAGTQDTTVTAGTGTSIANITDMAAIPGTTVPPVSGY